MCPQLTPQTGDNAPLDHSQAVRSIPPLAASYIASLRRRDHIERNESHSGGSYADRHLAETGHPFEHGCCVLPENVCAGCRNLLPREAKLKGERFCSRACREAQTQ